MNCTAKQRHGKFTYIFCRKITRISKVSQFTRPLNLSSVLLKETPSHYVLLPAVPLNLRILQHNSEMKAEMRILPFNIRYVDTDISLREET